MKKILILLLSAALTLSATGCGGNTTTTDSATTTTSAAATTETTTQVEESAASSTTQNADSAEKTENKETRIVKDINGEEVTVPIESYRIGATAPAFTTGIIMAGAVDKLVALDESIGGNDWILSKYPQLADLPVVFANNETNIEELLTTNPDLIFYAKRYGEETPKLLSGHDITIVTPAEAANTTRMEEMRDRQLFYANVIGGVSLEKGEKFGKYFDEKFNEITAITNAIPDDEKPRVLDIRALDPLTVISESGIGNEWIEIGGGKNAAAGTNLDPGISGSIEVTEELVLSWDPEIIICDDAAFIQEIYDDSIWSTCSAVKNKQVYAMPRGSMAWGYYGPEEALMIQWSAKMLQPEKFADMDMVAITQDFYKEFFGLDLTDDEINKMLLGNQ